MFKNALVYRIEHWAPPTLTEMEERLSGARFIECAATQPESAGWVAPRGDKHAALAESIGGQVVFKLCTETKAVPGGAVKLRCKPNSTPSKRKPAAGPRASACAK